MKKYKTLQVFLASSGDLPEERQAAQRAVDEVNSTVKELGWQIEVDRWEDATPGVGRAQGLIPDKSAQHTTEARNETDAIF